MMRAWFLAAIATGGCIDLDAASRDRPLQRIEAPNAQETFAMAINGAGQIVGTFWSDSGPARGFMLDGDVYTLIDVPGATSTQLQAIDDAGRIYGYYTSTDGRLNPYTGFVLDAGRFTDLGPGFVTGANAAGDLVGIKGDQGYAIRQGVEMAIVYPERSTTGATSINANGDITGYAFNSGSDGSILDRVQFVQRGERFETLDPPPDATTMSLTGINDAGIMAGTIQSEDGHHAFLYHDGVFTLIDGPYRETHTTSAYGIGPRGEVLGSFSLSYQAANGSIGFVYRPGL